MRQKWEEWSRRIIRALEEPLWEEKEEDRSKDKEVEKAAKEVNDGGEGRKKRVRVGNEEVRNSMNSSYSEGNVPLELS